jgi:predicted glycoside hydrolase/deacetylase ChbG (UPF0249 family)
VSEGFSKACDRCGMRLMLIVNADDWGRSRAATDSAAVCYEKGRISSTSAMVFMADSARGAEIAKELEIDVGLHINFSEEFSGHSVPLQVREAQIAIRRFLKASRYALLLYNPFLRRQFSFVLRAQSDEFGRLYGRAPSHMDGHQHMHLCSNNLFDQLLPSGMKIRRSFSFAPGEKGTINRAYRAFVDRRLAHRYRLTDYFFALSLNLQRERLSRIINLAKDHSVEMMTHPQMQGEFECLMGDEYADLIKSVRVGSYSSL